MDDTTELPLCPICGTDDFEIALDRISSEPLLRRPGWFRLDRCRGCALLMTRPRPTAEALPGYYAVPEGDDDELRRLDLEGPLGRWLHTYRLNLIRKVAQPGPDDVIVDVGCAWGGFLSLASERTGCRGIGVDFDTHRVAGANASERLRFLSGAFVDVDLEPGSATIVAMYESLEHMPDPVAAVRAAHGVLRPGGLLVVEVPDYGSWWRPVFGRSWMSLAMTPQHLFQLEKDTLLRLVRAGGFTDVRYHQSMFVPTELTLAAAIALSQWGPARGRSSPLAGWARVLLAVLWATVDIPTQLVLRYLGRSGHQVLMARRGGDPTSPGGP